MKDLSERRLVIFPDRVAVAGKFAGVKSLCCIEVKSSAVFSVSTQSAYLTIDDHGPLWTADRLAQ